MGRRLIITRSNAPVVPEYNKTKAYYLFDNNSRDSYTTNLHATTGTSMSYTTGYYSNAISSQQGTSAAYNIKFTPSLGFTGTNGSPITNNLGITCGGWFYKRSGGGNNQGVLYVGSSNTPGGFGLYIPDGTTNAVNLIYGGLVAPSIGFSFTNTTWTHVVYILSSIKDGTIWPTYVYINGVKVYTYNTQNPRQPDVSTYGFQIACMSNNGNFQNQQFYGYVDNFFLNVGTTWTDEEVLNYYNSIK